MAMPTHTHSGARWAPLYGGIKAFEWVRATIGKSYDRGSEDRLAVHGVDVPAFLYAKLLSRRVFSHLEYPPTLLVDVQAEVSTVCIEAAAHET